MLRSIRLCRAAAAALCLTLLLATGAARAVTAGNGAWSWQDPLPQGGDLTAGFFLDAAHGWLTSGGRIFRTTDGGATLKTQARHNVMFRDITFADARHGWAVGKPAGRNGTGIVFRTTDGGRTWTRVRLGVVGSVKAVSFAGPRVGFAVCARSVLRTVDGGRHWKVAITAKRLLSDVQALSTRRVWACGDKGTLLRSTNGGLTWKRVASGTAENLVFLRFPDRRDGWVAGDRTVLHSSDAGAHWTVQAKLGPVITGVDFADANTGWIASARGYPGFGCAVYGTTDGGAHWTRLTILSGFFRSWIVALTSDQAVIGGAGGRLSHMTDGGATWQPSWRTAADFTGDFTAVRFANARTGWAAGAGGTILMTADAGRTWSAQVSGTTADLAGLCFLDANDGWTVGKGGTILHTVDGGAVWIPQTSGVADDLEGVAFVDALHGWAVGGTVSEWRESSTGVILSTVDGGQHWVQQTDPVPTAILHDVAFADAGHGWAVGEVVGDSATNVTVILATSDGGATWTKQLEHMPIPNGNTSDGRLRAVACADARHVVAVGYDDGSTEVFRTTNGGKTWRSIPFVDRSSWSSFVRMELTDVSLVDATHGWAVGDDTVIRTVNGGLTWTRLSIAPAQGVALSFVDRRHGWVVGQDAAILRTSTGGSKQ
jgi:photosystem II stability/assembly factor-like uncharacterized protein